MSRREIARRTPRLLLGLTLFGVGSALQVHAALGVAPWVVLHQGISLHTPLSIGGAAIAVSFLVLLLWIPLAQRPGVGTLANAVLVGIALDTTLVLLPESSPLGVRLALFLVGVVLVGMGSGFYIGVRMGPGPRDGLMTGLAARGFSIRRARTLVEVGALAIGWLLGGDVGLGTLVFATIIGPLVHFFIPLLDMGAPTRRPAP